MPVMEKINLNHLAREVTIKEAGEDQANIAEVKQIQGIVLKELAKFTDEQILEVINRQRTEGSDADI